MDQDKTPEQIIPEERPPPHYIIDTTHHMSMYVIGSVAGVFFILTLCVVIMLIKNRSKPLRPSDLCIFDTTHELDTCKSAPISRSQSPVMTKRGSCPNAYGSIDDVILYPEAIKTPPSLQEYISVQKIQPGDTERSKSITTLSECQKGTSTLSRSDSDPTSHDLNGGRVWFTATFDQSRQELIVLLIKIRDLKSRGSNGDLRDPFVKVTLLPEEHVSLTSKMVRRTLNPIFNETFQFKVPLADLESKALRLTVYDVDKRRIRHSLGHVIVRLSDLDMMAGKVLCKHLQNGQQSSLSVGEMNVGLVYLPNLDKVKVIVMKVQNVRQGDSPNQGLFVQLECFYGKRQLKTKQTLMQRSGEETIFNESFSFHLAGRNIENFRFTLKLMMTSRDDVTSEHIDLGHVDLGSFMYARGAGLIHWQEMLAKTRTVVSRWHQLAVPI